MNPVLRRCTVVLRGTRVASVVRRIRRLPMVPAMRGMWTDRLFGIAAVTGVKPPIAADRGPAPVVPEDTLKAVFENSGLSGEPDTYVLYRIIGNDIEPRHRRGQSRRNIEFILDNEPDLPKCEKRWVVNRIVDQSEERAICDLLEAHGQPYPVSYTHLRAHET